jgi:hypothetical protein
MELHNSAPSIPKLIKNQRIGMDENVARLDDLHTNLLLESLMERNPQKKLF